MVNSRSLDHRAIELKQNGYKASPFNSFKHRAFPPSASVYGAITQASSPLVDRDLHLTTRFVSSNFRFSQPVAFVLINWTSPCNGVKFSWINSESWMARDNFFFLFSRFLGLFWMAIRGQWNKSIGYESRELKIVDELTRCAGPSLCTVIRFVEVWNDCKARPRMSHRLLWFLLSRLTSRSLETCGITIYNRSISW